MTNEGDSRFHIGMSAEVLEHRRKHDRIVDDLVRAGSRYVALRVKIEPDARFIRALEDASVLGAYERIQAALHIEASRLGARAVDLSAAKGMGVSDPTRCIALLEAFNAWYQQCKIRKMTPMWVIDTIMGKSPSQIDADSRMGNGTALKRIIACLEVY